MLNDRCLILNLGKVADEASWICYSSTMLLSSVLSWTSSAALPGLVYGMERGIVFKLALETFLLRFRLINWLPLKLAFPRFEWTPVPESVSPPLCWSFLISHITNGSTPDAVSAARWRFALEWLRWCYLIFLSKTLYLDLVFIIWFYRCAFSISILCNSFLRF